MKNKILGLAGLHALGTAIYVGLVASLLFYSPNIFASSPKETVLIPIAMLMLFVVSALITGSLVLGRPIMWYLDGKKKEAVSLLMTTAGFLIIITLLAFAGLAF